MNESATTIIRRRARLLDGRTEFKITTGAHRFITSQLGTRTIRFWSMPPNSTSPAFRPITSTYLWQWNRVNKTLPNLTREEADKVPSGTRMVLLVYRGAGADDALASLRRSASTRRLSRNGDSAWGAAA